MVVFNGAEVPDPPQERRVVTCSQAVVAAPEAFIAPHVVAEINNWGEPVSSEATHPKQGLAAGQL